MTDTPDDVGVTPSGLPHLTFAEAMARDPDDLLLQMVTSKNPSVEALGRMTATGIDKLMLEWMMAELARGTKPADIVDAYMVGTASLFATMFWAFIIPGHEQQVIDVYSKTITTLPGMIEQFREWATQKKEGTPNGRPQ